MNHRSASAFDSYSLIRFSTAAVMVTSWNGRPRLCARSRRLSTRPVFARVDVSSPGSALALKAIEHVHPMVVAPQAALSASGYRAYVPHNQGDLVAAAWCRGNFDASIALHRVEKDHRPHRIKVVDEDLLPFITVPLDATRSIRANCFGRSGRRPFDLLSRLEHRSGHRRCHARRTTSQQLPVERWTPTRRGGRRLRVHRIGSLDALTRATEGSSLTW